MNHSRLSCKISYLFSNVADPSFGDSNFRIYLFVFFVTAGLMLFMFVLIENSIFRMSPFYLFVFSLCVVGCLISFFWFKLTPVDVIKICFQRYWPYLATSSCCFFLPDILMDDCRLHFVDRLVHRGSKLGILKVLIYLSSMDQVCDTLVVGYTQFHSLLWLNHTPRNSVCIRLYVVVWAINTYMYIAKFWWWF